MSGADEFVEQIADRVTEKIRPVIETSAVKTVNDVAIAVSGATQSPALHDDRAPGWVARHDPDALKEPPKNAVVATQTTVERPIIAGRRLTPFGHIKV